MIIKNEVNRMNNRVSQHENLPYKNYASRKWSYFWRSGGIWLL